MGRRASSHIAVAPNAVPYVGPTSDTTASTSDVKRRAQDEVEVRVASSGAGMTFRGAVALSLRPH